MHRLHNYVSDVRAVLRRTGGHLTHPGQRYVPTIERLDIDLWRMHAALREAQTTDTDKARLAALCRTVDLSGWMLAATYRR